MKEALDKIKAAEMRNEELQMELQKDLQEYSAQKEAELQLLQDGLKAKRQQASDTSEKIAATALQSEKEELLAVAKKEKATFTELYKERHEKVATFIIERVQQTYGS
ncbi:MULTISPECIES: hypothetical protein [Enterococcus]|uniref:hypothetical protein n=1 Tax=Enterococcus TaxID=1350 RepID=UPI00189EBB25|nr:hypothetical protein [Enterococcus dispar]MCU7358253.1 hypothetical protein [Enterococcus dispar]MDT2706413.1 hypothetical protein [Enterococcus dispar]WCG33393.1 hypothetical protein PML78_01510 [Enterococcus dispar]